MLTRSNEFLQMHYWFFPQDPIKSSNELWAIVEPCWKCGLSRVSLLLEVVRDDELDKEKYRIICTTSVCETKGASATTPYEAFMLWNAAAKLQRGTKGKDNAPR